MTLAALCCFAFIAGLLDAMVGGGGLVQVPALLILLPNTAPAAIFGTNKLSMFVGTTVAAYKFARSVKIPWQIVLIGAAAAFVFAFLGARAVSLMNPNHLKPLVLVLLIAMTMYTVKDKNFGTVAGKQVSRTRQIRVLLVLGTVVGFYDGFFGPGTGTFFIVGLIALCGFDFLKASAAAKVLNMGTNLAALIYFASTSNILYSIAIPMAVANALGSLVGSHLAILKGSRFVRVVFLVVCLGLAARLAFDIFM